MHSIFVLHLAPPLSSIGKIKEGEHKIKPCMFVKEREKRGEAVNKYTWLRRDKYLKRGATGQ